MKGEEKNKFFGMAARPFLCNGVLLDHFNLPRVIQMVFQMYKKIVLVPIPFFNVLFLFMVDGQALDFMHINRKL